MSTFRYVVTSNCLRLNIRPLTCLFVTPAREKHYNPKFKRERAKKVLKIEIPDYDSVRKDEKLTLEEIRAKLKEKGIAPPRKWSEKPIFISCTGGLIDAYVPPEGDGKVTLISSPGVKQKYDFLAKKGKSYMALRKIRNFEYDFDVPTFADKAQEIYVEAHKALAVKDEEKLHDLVTEKCFPEMMENVTNKTMSWKFIQSLEFPRVVHIRCQEMLTRDSIFAQATVRLHTQQTLAVYDRFGHLMHGSEDMVKDDLEYVVYEKYLSGSYGEWRIHAKIIPDWVPPREPILKTFRIPKFKEKEDTDTTETKNAVAETSAANIEQKKETSAANIEQKKETNTTIA